ncbi:MAG TPA: RIP metalloprotease RseP [Chitinophagaceae bacterium]|nr:RIP metalloprotease RseP [Chitinophagaceae bacterium]HND95422.1 RIP metalloprotease RseP [Chitinophagaceae bacterium]HNJ25250.1 RIP metalloprotease RseP [Chitinophagaceae bacterium]HNJ55450.1 RIP metalloprotease RseP [Chitinophagaceae bacterium]HNK60872.1 RIP metalloprotease RseP [Chitinophagaceae bacterium]
MNNLLAIDWSTVGVKAAQFILSFSILILLHEFGHFITAKWFKCRVEKFYLFFNPWFSLWKKKKGETEYGLGWIPLGGYVKITGMIDESMDKEQMKQPPQPYEFRSKPAWQRLIIMLAGIIVNILLAIVIFIFILWIWGKEYMPPSGAKYGIGTDSLAQTIGFKDGDMILKVGGKDVKNLLKLRADIVYNDGPDEIKVKRGDSIVVLKYDDQLRRKLNSRNAADFVFARTPFIVKKITAGGVAEKAGLKAGDQLLMINGQEASYFHQYANLIKGKKNEKISLTVLRGTDTVTSELTLDKNGKMGVERKTPEDLGFKFETKKYTLLESISGGFSECWNTLGMYMKGLKQLFNGQAKASESVGSVFSIGGIYPGVWDWHIFWTLTAVFSVILAFMNLLPIPGLDGGHALFTLIEMITGRKPSEKFLEYAQIVGMILLFGLMAYALGLDIFRMFK